MKIVFRVEEKDLEAIQQKQFDLTRLGKIKRIQLYLTIFALYLGCLCIQHFLLHGSTDSRSLLVELVVLPGTIGLTAFFLEWKVIGGLLKRKPAYFGEIGTHVYELSDDSLFDRMEGKTDVARIREIASVERHDDFVYLFLNDMRSGIIPVHGVLEGNLDEFIQRLTDCAQQNRKSRGLFQFD